MPASARTPGATPIVAPGGGRRPVLAAYLMTNMIRTGEAKMSETAVWSVAQAKARLSEVIDRALKEGPQEITRNGRPAVVVVAIEEWARKTGRKGTLAEFFAASPLRGSDLEIERARGGAREVDL